MARRNLLTTSTALDVALDTAAPDTLLPQASPPLASGRPHAGNPELGKYADGTTKRGGWWIIGAYKYHASHLYVNTAQHTAPQRATSVMGVIAGMVAAQPGITGRELVAAMVARTTWVSPTKYTRDGIVCAMWAEDYVIGALGNKLRHLVTGPAPTGN